MKIAVWIAAVALLASLAALASNDMPTHGEMKDMKAYVEMLIEARILIGLEPEKNYGSVNPVMWRGLKANEKEAVIGTLAMYCEGLKTGQTRVPIGRGTIELKDASSGVPIARFDNGKLSMAEQAAPY